MTLEELIQYFNELRARASTSAAPIVRNMASRYRQYVQREELRRYSHPMYTHTPAPRGGPPAWMTGELSRSITIVVSGGGIEAAAVVSPHTIYAAVQEFGRVIRARNHPHMRYLEDGRWHFPEVVDIPKRPYMRPALEATIADGSLLRAAIEAFEGIVGI
jgi:phage gpG-like protein